MNFNLKFFVALSLASAGLARAGDMEFACRAELPNSSPRASITLVSADREITEDHPSLELQYGRGRLTMVANVGGKKEVSKDEYQFKVRRAENLSAFRKLLTGLGIHRDLIAQVAFISEIEPVKLYMPMTQVLDEAKRPLFVLLQIDHGRYVHCVDRGRALRR